ncbi:MAG: hypothetical protein PHZ19_05305 [Candidatus Thermoplasmatota archaeon]|nr:hypothetical protein [Candidatus Thermoplasmatota archaeon]
MGIRVEVISGEHKGLVGTMLFETKYHYFIIPEPSNKEEGEKSLLVIEKNKAQEIHNYNPSR